MDKLTIREAMPADVPALLDIYAYYVNHTAVTFEYDVPGEEEFTDRMLNFKKRYPYIVAELDGVIVGYSYAHAFVARAAYDWSCEMTIYLHKDYRGRGLGKLLYAEMERLLGRMGMINLYSCIAIPRGEDPHLRPDSELFHERLGYKRVGLFERCGYKFDRWYDMIWMEKLISERPEKPIALKVCEY